MPAERGSRRTDADLPVPLTVLYSPYREITDPLLAYIARLRRDGPRDLVAVYIPEYVVGHWWESLLHNQSALRLKLRLRLLAGVMVISVPWQVTGADDAVASELAAEAAATNRAAVLAHDT